MVFLHGIYGDRLNLHYDLYEQSNLHREQHGTGCTVYPSSPAKAALWPFLTALVRARRFLEVGCGLGYTAALMAEAGGTACQVDTIESLAEHADLAERELSRRGLASRIRVLRGPASEILPRFVDPYDIIFVDAEWAEYPDLLPHLTRLTNLGGMLVTSNISPFRGGKEAIEEYLTRLIADDRFRTYIIPGQWHALSYRVS